MVNICLRIISPTVFDVETTLIRTLVIKVPPSCTICNRTIFVSVKNICILCPLDNQVVIFGMDRY